MIDIHCHILPAVDDGSRNIQMTKELIVQAMENEITEFIATPHTYSGMKEDDIKEILKVYDDVQKLISKENMNCRLYMGGEILYSDSVIDDLVNKKLFTLNDTDYVLVEFPTFWEYSSIKNAVKKLRYAGYKPILAHIERYNGTSKIENVEKLIELGAYMQVNCSAVAGEMGFLKKNYILKLMKYDMIHFMATDTHRTNWRTPDTEKAFRIVDKKFGKEYRDLITVQNQMKVVAGETLCYNPDDEEED